MLLLSMTLSAAWAHCTLAALETTLRAGASPERTDRWTWRVEEGPPDCAQVHLASPQAAPIQEVRVQVQRLDGRSPRVRGPRQEAVATSLDPSFGPAPGLVLHTPEVQASDLLLVEVTRPWALEGGGFTWRPGARGPLEVATLRVEGEVTVRAEGLVLPSPVLEQGARAWLVEAVPAGGPEPVGGEVARRVGPARVEQVEGMLLPARRPVRGLSEPSLGRRLEAWRQEGGLPSRVAWPADALLRWCRQGPEGRPCEEEGGLAWALPAQGEATWGWLRPGASASGEALLRGEGPRTTSRFTLLAPSDEVALMLPEGVESTLDPVAATEGGLLRWLGLQALPEGLAPWLAEAAPLRLAASAEARDLAPAGTDDQHGPRVAWRLRRLDGRPILPEAVAAEQAVAWLAVRASIPEPALPAELRGRKADPSALDALLVQFHARLHAGTLPGARPLEPRRLLRVRKSGWGTPWELALVLTRYLQQLKLDALPLPVRPVGLGPPDGASLTDFPLAVVRVQAGGWTRFVDPTCPTCGPGELRPALDGAVALSPALSALPALPPSTWERRVAPSGQGLGVGLAIEGPLAVQLRAELSAVPAAARGPWLAARLVGPGARLVSHAGLVEGGQPVVLDFEGPVDLDLVPLLAVPSPEGGPTVVLPARGTFIERRVVGAAPEALSAWTAPEAPGAWTAGEASGLGWRREVRALPEGGWLVEDRLEATEAVVDRAAASALLGAFRRVGREVGEGAAAEGGGPPAGSAPGAPVAPADPPLTSPAPPVPAGPR